MNKERHQKNFQEIKSFLEENDVSFSVNDEGYFISYDKEDGKRGYEIVYIPSELYPIAYPKYNIDGVDKEHFFRLSHEAEHKDNSFKCWVKDYEWEDDRKREVLKSYFLHACGKTRHKYYARECVIKEVSSAEARLFESKHCFYGKRGASLNLGLYTKKEKNGVPAGTLLMIYTFGKNFFGKNNDIEVLRVGTQRFSQVLGGASKLLTHFLRNYPTLQVGQNIVPVKRLKFYSDYDHNLGASMDTLGFKFVNYSKGGFMNLWLETGEVKGRQPGKHKWVMEQMRQGKVLAIPNAGVKTFILDVDNE